MDRYETRRLRFIQLRDEKCGGSNAAMGRILGKDSSYVSRIISEPGKPGRKRIGEDIRDQVEDSFNLPRGWLDNIDSSANTAPATLSDAKVPLISWVAAGMLSDIVDNHHPGQADHWVRPEYTNPSKHAFALRVEGDSMSGGTNGINFPDGCLIIVDPDRSPKSGDYVVAKDVLTQKATFKKLTTDGASWFLKPINPAYPTKEIDDPALRVVGVVIEWQIGGKL